jgi:hypothetical protein
MSHSTIPYVKPPAKIGTPESVGTLATARMPSTAGKLVSAGPPVTAGTAETPTIPKAERPARGNHQEPKGCQQQQECLTAEGRPITTRMPEIVETSQQQY